MDALNIIIQYVVLPVAGFVWLLHTRTNTHATEIAVLKATTSVTKEAHDREFKEMRENFKAVITKLDSIEEALRK